MLSREDLRRLISRFEARHNCFPDARFMPPALALELFGTSKEGTLVFDGLLVTVTLSASEPEQACPSVSWSRYPI